MEQTTQELVTLSDGGRLSLSFHGERAGPALVILPGVMSDADEWSRVAAAVTAWRGVVVVNRRGRPPSGPLPRDYSLESELGDLTAVLERVPGVAAVFGWSYGGLIALALASRTALRHVIAYEPVIHPFAAHALPALAAARAAGDLDELVRVVVHEVSGAPVEQVEALRADPGLWARLRRLAEPVHAETAALGTAALPAMLGGQAARVDLVVGSRNVDRPPYGTAFDDVVRRVEGAAVHELPDVGHLVQVEAPEALAALLDRLAAWTPPSSVLPSR